MVEAKFVYAVQGEWLRLQPIRVGPIPSGVGTPDVYVTVTDHGAPLARVDVYSEADVFTFRQAVVWQNNVFIGWGSCVHAVSLIDRSSVSIALGAYFCLLHTTADYLLIASGQRLIRVEPDRSVRWRSRELGVDGVIVRAADSEVIRGDGEWDPPGGWREFTLNALTGDVLTS